MKLVRMSKKMILIACISISSLSAFATKEGEKLKEAVAEQLSTSTSKDGSVMIRFSVNENRELILRSVQGESDELRSFVAHKLRNAELNLAGINPNKCYNLTVVFKRK